MTSREPPPVIWLNSFVAVVEQGTFTAAAQALNRAQPRVSAHVASLERHLGAKLLIRGTRRVELTAAGSALLPHARAVLRELRAGADAVGALTSTLQGRLALGSYPGAMAVLIAPLVRQFQARYPGVTVDLHEAEPALLEDLVAAGDIDLAIRTADVPQRHHNVPSTLLFHERIQLIVRRDHRLSGLAGAEPTALSAEPVIVSGNPPTGWTDYRDRLDRLGIEPLRLITVSQPTTVVALVREGLGVGLLGALAAKVTVGGDIRAVDLPMPLWRREIRAYRRSDAKPTPAVTAFTELMAADAPALTLGCAIWPESAEDQR